MKGIIEVPGGGSYPVEELRLRADKLALAGQHEEGALLHVLIDRVAGAKDAKSLQAELLDVKRDVKEMEQSRDKALKHLREMRTLLAKLPKGEKRDEVERKLDDVRDELTS